MARLTTLQRRVLQAFGTSSEWLSAEEVAERMTGRKPSFSAVRLAIQVLEDLGTVERGMDSSSDVYIPDRRYRRRPASQ